MGKNKKLSNNDALKKAKKQMKKSTMTISTIDHEDEQNFEAMHMDTNEVQFIETLFNNIYDACAQHNMTYDAKLKKGKRGKRWQTKYTFTFTEK